MQQSTGYSAKNEQSGRMKNTKKILRTNIDRIFALARDPLKCFGKPHAIFNEDALRANEDGSAAA